MGQFELFTERNRRVSDTPAATIQARGAIGLNALAYELLGNPEHVLLYFDAQDKRIGIAPADEGNPYAYPARTNGAQGQGRLISARSFLVKSGVDHEKTVPVDVTKEGDMLILSQLPMVAGGQDGLYQ